MNLSIILLTSEFPPHVGGIASHVEELSRFLAPLVGSVTVINPVGPWSGMSGHVPPGVTVLRPSLLKFQPAYDFMLHRWLSRFLSSRPTPGTLLHVHGVRPLGATRGLPVPTVFTNHSSGFLRRREAAPARQRRTARLLDHVGALIAPSDELVEAARSFGYRGPATMIANGVDPGRFHPAPSPLRAQLGIGADEVVVLLARRLVEKNGVMGFAQALTRLGDLRFRVLIAGDGPERAPMSAELAAAGMLDRVIFLGAVANTEMPAVYRAADVAVLPSLAEATSIAGLEAMACALPLVGTRVGGIPTIIDDERSGLLVPPRDPEALAAALAALICDGDRRRRLGAAARERIEREFSWPIIARRTLAVYQDCPAGAGR
ncbi:MAG: glycosyltransferase family 4 protein [Rhodospirillaceae bacterium]